MYCTLEWKKCTIFEKEVKMKFSDKVCAHGKFIVVLNGEKTNIWTKKKVLVIKLLEIYVCAVMKFDFYIVPKRFNIHDGGYMRVAFPESSAKRECKHETNSW